MTTATTTEYWKWEKQNMLHGCCCCYCYCFSRVHCLVSYIYICTVFFYALHFFHLFNFICSHFVFRFLFFFFLPLARHIWFSRFVFSLKFYVSRCFVCAHYAHITQCQNRPQKTFYMRKNGIHGVQNNIWRDSPLKNNMMRVDFFHLPHLSWFHSFYHLMFAS